MTDRSRVLRLPCRRPLDWSGLLGCLGARAIPGVEEVTARAERRRPWRAYAVMALWLGPGLSG